MEGGPDWWGVCWGGGHRGGHISGFNKNAKILYFVTKLLQGRQITHKSVTDFLEICKDFHTEKEGVWGPNAFRVLLTFKSGNEVAEDDGSQ